MCAKMEGRDASVEVVARGSRGLSSREIALISLFASVWIAAQITLGPIIGRFSIGPVSLHGVVNRVVGWSLMVVLADRSRNFGRVSMMALIASLGTRMIRLSPLSGFVTGVGYALGGLIFDYMFFRPSVLDLAGWSRRAYLILISVVSGLLAMLPYVLFRFAVLSLEAFIALTPYYALSMVKGVVFSVIGASLGLSILHNTSTVV